MHIGRNECVLGGSKEIVRMNKTFLKNNALLFGCYLVFLLIMCYTFLYTNRDDLHVQINQHVGNALVDNFFFYITFLGDGKIAVVLLLLAFFYNVRFGTYLTLVFIFAALTTNLLKYQFFNDHFRPYWIYQYQNPYQVKKVAGEDLMIYRSFPSGHATQAFALFFACALVAVKHYFKLAFLILAITVAFSRVYLAQHWLKDITAGSIVGVVFAVVLYFIFYKKERWAKLDRPLMKAFKK